MHSVLILAVPCDQSCVVASLHEPRGIILSWWAGGGGPLHAWETGAVDLHALGGTLVWWDMPRPFLWLRFNQALLMHSLPGGTIDLHVTHS